MATYIGSTQPGAYDNEETLLRKIAQSLFNTYGETGSAAHTGPVKPDTGDNKETLLRKIAQMLNDAL